MKSVWENEAEVLLCAHLVTPKHSQGQWKWNKKIKVNGAYKHNRYKQVWLKSLNVMSDLKFLPHKMDGWMVGQLGKHNSQRVIT